MPTPKPQPNVPPPHPAPHRPTPLAAAIPVLESAALFQGAAVVHIQHHGERYQLRITRQGKLLLTK